MAGVTSEPDSYHSFASVYDRSLGQLFFTVVSRHLRALLERYPPGSRTHLDIACGTGLVIEFFESEGYKSTGVDASLPMLEIAAARAKRLVAGDFRALPLQTTFSHVTCLYDSLNHVLEMPDLIETFRSVRAVMDRESSFWFDVNHPSAYPAIWGMSDPYISEGEDYFLSIDTSYSRSDQLATGVVTGWSGSGSGRIAIDEIHHQRPYREKDIVIALRKAELRVVESFRFNPFRGGREKEGGKIFFVAAAA